MTTRLSQAPSKAFHVCFIPQMNHFENDEVQDMLSQNMATWHLRKQLKQGGPSDLLLSPPLKQTVKEFSALPLKQVIRPSHERFPEEGSTLIYQDQGPREESRQAQLRFLKFTMLTSHCLSYQVSPCPSTLHQACHKKHSGLTVLHILVSL